MNVRVHTPCRDHPLEKIAHDAFFAQPQKWFQAGNHVPILHMLSGVPATHSLRPETVKPQCMYCTSKIIVLNKTWRKEDKLLFRASNLVPVTESPVHQAPSHYSGYKLSPHFPLCAAGWNFVFPFLFLCLCQLEWLICPSPGDNANYECVLCMPRK